MAQQTNMTAVEWLEQEFNDTFYVAQSSEIAKRFERIFEQAKQMEKEQIIKARINGDEDHSLIAEKRQEYAEQYYNQTYSKQ